MVRDLLENYDRDIKPININNPTDTAVNVSFIFFLARIESLVSNLFYVIYSGKKKLTTRKG